MLKMHTKKLLMFKRSTCYLFAALVATTLAASAQTAPNRDDMFGQDMPAVDSLGSSAMSASSQRKVRIVNDPAAEGGAGEREQDRDLPRTNAEATRLRAPQDGELTPHRKPARSGASAQGDSRREVDDGKPEVISEFQKFLWDNTGQLLPVYGANFFPKSAPSFAPAENTPLPAEHPLGPGDELLIRGTGTIDIDFRATIDRNGTISIPIIGTVVLAGVRAGEAENVVNAAVARLYKGVNVSVSFGRLRAITVYVVGQAKWPGTYTVSSLSSLVTGLFASGGPNANGSMRRVQLRRAGRVVSELDLYAFIAKGDKTGDSKLQDGDTIFIPPAGGFVALVGKVNAPAIYELKSSDETVRSLLDIAGGLPIVADPRRVFLERIDPDRNQPRSVEQFALDTHGMRRSLKSGDVLNVTSITPDFSNAVVLRGNVDQAVRVPFANGMRISDLIPSRDYLITRSSIKRHNNAANDEHELEGEGKLINDESASVDSGRREQSIASRIGGVIDEINWDYAVVERINRADLTVSLIPFNLGEVFANPAGQANVLLQPGDTVTVFSQQDVAVPMDKRRVFARVEGEVAVPGVYQMSAGETLQSLLAKAGGPTANAYLFGTAFYREQVRKEQQKNLEKAAVRLEAQLRAARAKNIANTSALSPTDAAAASAQRDAELQIAEQTITRFRQLKPTGRIAFGLGTNEKSFARLPQLKLENGDRLVVPARPEFVHVFGAVNVEASPLWRPNSRVKDYLGLSGITPDADMENLFIIRVDGTVATRSSNGWFSTGVGSMEIMPGDSIVIPEKIDKETTWTKFTRGTREWAQIFANFGLGAAAIQTLRN